MREPNTCVQKRPAIGDLAGLASLLALAVVLFWAGVSPAYAAGGAAESANAVAQAKLVEEALTYDPLHDPDYVDSSAGTGQAVPFGLAPLAEDGVVDQAADAIKEALRTYAQVSYTLSDGDHTRYGVRFPSSMGLTSDQVNVAMQLVWDDPEFFFAPFQVSMLSSGSVVLYVVYDFDESVDVIDSQRAELEREAATALTWVSANMTPVYQAQALHDYLVRTCAYNSAAANATDGSYSSAHTAYGALVEKKPVCQGYAMAYKLLLARLGIPCIYVASSEMNHGWNMVQLDDVWYHVDVTWDDPLIVGLGSTQGVDQGFDAVVAHDYFLKSDDTFKKMKHSGWESAVSAPQDYAEYDYPEYKGATGACAGSHTAGEQLKQNAVAATCTVAGSYDLVTYCSACGEELLRESVVVSSLGHSPARLEAVAPTCTATGLTEGSACCRCQEVLAAQQPVDALGHDFAATPATATPPARRTAPRPRGAPAAPRPTRAR